MDSSESNTTTFMFICKILLSIIQSSLFFIFGLINEDENGKWAKIKQQKKVRKEKISISVVNDDDYNASDYVLFLFMIISTSFSKWCFLGCDEQRSVDFFFYFCVFDFWCENLWIYLIIR